MSQDHIHTVGDGKGLRCAYVNGKAVPGLVHYANTKTGKVRYAPIPIKLDKHRKRVLTKTMRGFVEIVYLDEPEPYKPLDRSAN